MIPAHVFPDNSLNQSLFGILDITDKGYDVTFNGAGVAIQYQGAPIYFQEKLPTDLFWQLPLSPVLNRDQEAAHAQEEINVCIANSTTALQSDEDFVAFMHAPLSLHFSMRITTKLVRHNPAAHISALLQQH